MKMIIAPRICKDLSTFSLSLWERVRVRASGTRNIAALVRVPNPHPALSQREREKT